MSRAEPTFAVLAIDKIDPGRNVRLEESELASLVESIRKHGVLQPITVVPTEDGEHAECLFGHRRLAAARAAGLAAIPCMVRERGSDDTRVLTQLAENRDRKNLSPLEEGLAYDKLRKLGMTQQQIADAVGTQQTGVSMRLILLTYPDVIQQAVHHGNIGLSDALAVPMELAQSTDTQRLRMLCRAGSRSVRQWALKESKDAEKRGEPMQRVRAMYEKVNIDARIMDVVRDEAKLDGVKVVEWVRHAIEVYVDVCRDAREDEAAS
jgi:ParB/RepB/Spo0J family partition protein